MHQVRVRYMDDTGRRHFDEKTVLDFGLFWETQEVRRKGLHDIHKQIEKLAKHAESWSAVWGNGLLAVTPKDEDERLRERRQRQKQRQSNVTQQDEQPESTD